MMDNKVTCFISYSWDTEEHKQWVIKLSTSLQENGVVTFLDQWDAHPGIDLTEYMEKHIRESTFVILVCTPLFATKANEGLGGVGYEKAIVTGEIFQNVASPNKFVPILRRGTSNNALPSYLKSRKYIDFRDDKRFDTAFEELLRHIFHSPKYKRPRLGVKPKLPSHITKSREQDRTSEEYQQVYQFAHSRDGLNYNRQDAVDFTREWISEYSRKDFNVFQKVYRFAVSLSGMNLTYADSEDFAFEWIKLHYEKDFGVYMEAYQFAHNPKGLNYNRQSSEDFAENWISKHYTKDFKVFKEAFSFARSRDGMNLSYDAAEEFAFDVISKQ